MRADQCLQMYLLAGAQPGLAREELVPSAIDFLGPFFQMALKGQLQLKPYHQLSAAEVHESLTKSAGVQVDRIRFVDQPCVLPKQNHYFQQVERHLQIENLGKLVSWIESTFDNYLGLPLEDALNRALDQLPTWQQVIDTFRIDLRLAILSYLGFAVLGDRERQMCMGHALRLMRDTIPLGQDPEQPGTWILLAA